MSRKKVDITITKAATLNTGNFSSVKPEVSLTLKDVNIDDLMIEHQKLSGLADALFALNTISLLDETNTYNQVGMRHYLEALKDSAPQMEAIIRNYSSGEEDE
ncbi:MAG TPA: hypothetical protein P5293_01075 [Bacteroidales bacterium]|nr:hypothetical protein [Bacteroidales bacterium]